MVVRPGRGGDGHDGRDPLRQRPGDRRRAQPSARRASHVRAAGRRGRVGSPRPLGGAAPGRRARVTRRRVRPAHAALRAAAIARARVLRPPADRPADVARDRRSAVDPLLPRLRAGLPGAVRAGDRARRRRDVRDPSRPRRDRADPGAARRLRHLPLQPAGAPRVAGGPAADRRAHRGHRGEHLRRARRQGLCPRSAPARALRAQRPPRLRPVDGGGAAAGALQPADRLPAADRARRDPPDRRPRRDPPRALDRAVHRLLHLPADAAEPDAHARRVARHGPARDRLRRPRLRGARPRATR